MGILVRLMRKIVDVLTESLPVQGCIAMFVVNRESPCTSFSQRRIYVEGFTRKSVKPTAETKKRVVSGFKKVMMQRQDEILYLHS